MREISHCNEQRIVENGTRNVERHAMLARIRSSFDMVPLELKLELMQRLLSCIRAATIPF